MPCKLVLCRIGIYGGPWLGTGRFDHGYACGRLGVVLSAQQVVCRCHMLSVFVSSSCVSADRILEQPAQDICGTVLCVCGGAYKHKNKKMWVGVFWTVIRAILTGIATTQSPACIVIFLCCCGSVHNSDHFLALAS